MTARILRLVAISTLLASAVVTSAPTARAGTVFTYPGCNGQATLQGCITNTVPGDIVEIATSEPIDEFVTIDHSLTLRPAKGFAPSVRGVGVSDFFTAGFTIHATVQDLRTAGVDVELRNGSGHSVTLRRMVVSRFDEQDNGSLVALFIDVPAAISIYDSTIEVGLRQGIGIRLDTENPTGLVRFTAVGNRLSGFGNTDADGSGAGMDLGLGGASSRVEVRSNSFWSLGSCVCGAAAGLRVNVNGGELHEADVVGNTFEANVYGMAAGAFPGTTLRLAAFDNIFSNSVRSGIFLFGGTALRYRAGYNDSFGNEDPDVLDGHSAGSGNLQADPRYVDRSTGDLALVPRSPLVDAGVVCTPGGVAVIDAEGRFRLAGKSVDVGAYEFGAGAPTGKAVVGGPGDDDLGGTDGADILCGMGGADGLAGRGGADYVDGGGGPDALVGGEGGDRLFGREGGDCLDGRDGVGGNDALDGGPGTDLGRADAGDVRTSVESTGACA